MEHLEHNNESRDESDSTDEALRASIGEEYRDEDIKSDRSIGITVQRDISSLNRGFTAKEGNDERVACNSTDSETTLFTEVSLPDDIDIVEVPEEEEYDVDEDDRWEIPDWFLESVDNGLTRRFIVILVVPIWIVSLFFGLIKGDFPFVTTILAGPIMLILGYLFRRKETRE